MLQKFLVKIFEELLFETKTGHKIAILKYKLYAQYPTIILPLGSTVLTL